MTKATRIEEDLLGAREAPLEAHWGIYTLRAMENPQISGSVIGDEEVFVRGMVQVKKASVLTNGDLGALGLEVAGTIVWACDQVLAAERCFGQFPIDQFQGGTGTSVNMNTSEAITSLALEYLEYAKDRYDIIDPNDHVNKSQSMNDAYPTGFRPGLFVLVGSLIEELNRLIAVMRAKGIEFAHVLKMGCTQLQDAVPMSLERESEASTVLLEEEISRLHNNAALLLKVSPGATVVGTGLNMPSGHQSTAAGRLREITGLDIQGAHGLLEVTSDTGAYVSVHAAIKHLVVKLSKICNDLCLLSSGLRVGPREIRLFECQAEPSIMPAKVSPVIPEVVNQICFKAMGNDAALTFATETGQLQLNAMELVTVQAIFESISLFTRGMSALRKLCVVGIEANEEVCRRNVLDPIGIIIYFNPTIGHHNGDLVGRECARLGRGARGVVLEMGLLEESVLDEILSPENLLRPHFRGLNVYSGSDPSAPPVMSTAPDLKE